MGRELWGRTPVVTRSQEWVDAAPFRAHLVHLMTIGDLNASEVAQVAQIPSRAARGLLAGRTRPARRICPDVARRLLRVGPADVVRLERRLVPAEDVAARLRQLVRSPDGRLDLLAASLDVTEAELAAVLDGIHTCSQLVAVRVGVAYEEMVRGEVRRATGMSVAA